SPGDSLGPGPGTAPAGQYRPAVRSGRTAGARFQSGASARLGQAPSVGQQGPATPRRRGLAAIVDGSATHRRADKGTGRRRSLDRPEQPLPAVERTANRALICWPNGFGPTVALYMLSDHAP